MGQQPLGAPSLAVSITTSTGETVVNESINLPQLPSSEAQLVALPSWLPQAGTSYQLNLTAQLPDDEYPANNTFQSTMQATIFSHVAFEIGLVEEEPGSGIVRGDFNGDTYTSSMPISLPTLRLIVPGFSPASLRAGALTTA